MTTPAPTVRNPLSVPRWLKRFRRAVPRAEREIVIATLDVASLLSAFEQTADARTTDAYLRLIYVLSARRLEAPSATSVAERAALRARIAAIFGLTPLAVAGHLTRMQTRLRADQRTWDERRAAYLARVARRAAKARAAAERDEGGS